LQRLANILDSSNVISDLYSFTKNSVTLSEYAPIATALYGTYAPLGSVKNNEFPFSSIPPIINATPIGLAPAY